MRRDMKSHDRNNSLVNPKLRETVVSSVYGYFGQNLNDKELSKKLDKPKVQELVNAIEDAFNRVSEYYTSHVNKQVMNGGMFGGMHSKFTVSLVSGLKAEKVVQKVGKFGSKLVVKNLDKVAGCVAGAYEEASQFMKEVDMVMVNAKSDIIDDKMKERKSSQVDRELQRRLDALNDRKGPSI